MADPFIGPGKQHISIHVDRATYRVLCHLATDRAEPTPNHAAFRLIVNEVKRLYATEEWAANIVNEERIGGLNG